jgi:hypothetical protein
MKASAVLIPVLIAGIILSGCGKSAPQPANTNSSSNTPVLLSSPPYSTREPDRYQAILVTHGTADGPNSALFSNALAGSKGLVARMGTSSRQDFQFAGSDVSLITNEQGTYLVLPAKKLYASTAKQSTTSGTGEQPDTGVAPSTTLVMPTLGSAYEKIGPEQLNGRAAVKYRIRYDDNRVNETYVWVDDELKMPIRTETNSVSSDGSRTGYVTEFTEISTNPDPSLFKIATDFKSVTHDELIAALH